MDNRKVLVLVILLLLVSMIVWARGASYSGFGSVGIGPGFAPMQRVTSVVPVVLPPPGNWANTAPEMILSWMQSTFNQTIVASSSPLGPLAAGGNWRGSVLASDGRVIFVPSDNAYIGIYNPADNSYTQGPAHGESQANGRAFAGGALMGNGKILLAPRDSAYIGIFDPASNTYSRGPQKLIPTAEYSCPIVLADGKVALIPVVYTIATATRIAIYDPVANTVATGPMTTYGYWTSIRAPNGKVIMFPDAGAGSNKIGIYDHAAGTFTEGPAVMAYSMTSTLVPSGKIICLAFGSSRMQIYDPEANTLTLGNAVLPSGGAKFLSACLSADGKIILAPYSYTNIGIYDPVTDTYANGSTVAAGFYSISAISSGAVMAPWGSARVGLFSSGVTIPTENLTTPWVNKW